LTQKDEILSMLEFGRQGVACQEFADRFLYHKLSSRISDLKNDGYNIKFIKGDSAMSGRYLLIASPLKYYAETSGQFNFS